MPIAPEDVPPAGPYRIDPDRSRVVFHGRHLFGLGPVTATFTVVDGSIRVHDPVTTSTVVATVAAGSFTSDKPRRDTHVRSAALLDAERYPQIRFVSEEMREDEGSYVLGGIVTAHGTSSPVALVVDSCNPEAGGFRVHGQTGRIDRYSFGVTKVKGMAGRYLTLELDVLAVPID